MALFAAGNNPTPGNLVVLYWADQGTAQGSAKIAGYADMPSVTLSEGNKQLFGIGSREALAGIKGMREPNVSFGADLADPLFAVRCFGDGAGTQTLGTNDFDLWFGAKTSGTYTGWMDKVTSAKCNTISVNVANTPATEVQMQVEMWGKTYVTGQTVSTAAVGAPGTAGTLRAYGTPLTNHNLTVFNISPAGSGTTLSYLDQWRNIMVRRNHNLERCCPQRDQGDDVAASRAAGFIKPHNQEDAMEVQLHGSQPPAAWLRAADNSTLWGDGTTPAVTFTLSNTDAIPSGETVKTFVYSALYAEVVVTGLNGGDVSGEWDATLSILPRGVTISQTSTAPS